MFVVEQPVRIEDRPLFLRANAELGHSLKFEQPRLGLSLPALYWMERPTVVE
jgi:hypothetical protein